MEPFQLAGIEALEEALGAPSFLLFKHSLVCPISARAFAEYRAFLDECPGVPTAWLDVIDQRQLSQEIQARTSVRHESPQALWIRDGRMAWSASHGAITREALRAAYEASTS